MIYYKRRGYILPTLFQCRGSVFKTTLFIALPCAALSGLLNHFYPDGSLTVFGGGKGILREPAAWGGFSFLVGFLVVFRTSQAYNRFEEGATAIYRMRSEWFDAVCSITAFTKHSKAAPEQVAGFKELLIRLASMLHAAALAELEAGESDNAQEIWAHTFELIDPSGVDGTSIETMRICRLRVQLLFTWLHQVIVENIETGVLNIPPPLLSRAFQELSSGMVSFHDAMRIAYTPFPFPYAQTCDCILVMHWFLVPFVTSQWATNSFWAGVLCFIQVFILWTLNFTAIEIDHPFGKDANDLDGNHMQAEFNDDLVLLVSQGVQRTPTLSSRYSIMNIRTSDMMASCRKAKSEGIESSTEQVTPSFLHRPSTFVDIFTHVYQTLSDSVQVSPMSGIDAHMVYVSSSQNGSSKPYSSKDSAHRDIFGKSRLEPPLSSKPYSSIDSSQRDIFGTARLEPALESESGTVPTEHDGVSLPQDFTPRMVSPQGLTPLPRRELLTDNVSHMSHTPQSSTPSREWPQHDGRFVQTPRSDLSITRIEEDDNATSVLQTECG